jgi:hypothetical protein
MTAVTRPRGPLPARVYWTRRLLLVAVAFALVFGIARLLGSSGSGAPGARPVGAAASSSTPGTASLTPQATPGASGLTTGRAAKKTPSPSPTPLASPTGACTDSDVVATPSVKGTAYAGHSVVFTMTLTTLSSPACTWDVSSKVMAVKVTSGSDRIWSTQECSGAVPKQSVVVRKDHPVDVSVTWNGQRSDSDCTRSTAWAEPGYYHVIAASFGAEPVDVQFELKSPVPRTITATPTPTKDPTKATESSSPSASPTKKSR